MSAGYIGESFWDANTIKTVLLLLLMLLGMCLPAVVAFRHKDKKQGLISIICGMGGMLLLIPWIVSVIMVSKKYEMPRKQDGAVKPVILMASSIILLLLGGVSMAAGFGLRISFVVYGIGLLVATCLNGRLYWGGLMIMVPFLITALDFPGYHHINMLYPVIAMAAVCLIAYNLVRTFPAAGVSIGSQGSNTSKEARKKWEEQTVLGIKTVLEEKKNAPVQEKAQESKPQEPQNKGFKRLTLGRCPNGHFYDGDKYGECCPYCITSTVVTKSDSDVVFKSKEVVEPELLNEPDPVVEPERIDNLVEEPVVVPEPVVASATVEEKPAAAKEVSVTKPKELVVGWLMCTKGMYKGESFSLKQGRNYIGRSADMDICLAEDSSVAERNQATVIYEPRQRQFIVVPGDVHELCYLQNELVLSNTVMNEHDVLDVGDTSLMLIPCCGEHFTWDE